MSEASPQNTDGSGEGFCVQMQLGVNRDWVTVDIDLSSASNSEALKNTKFTALKDAAVGLITKAYPDNRLVGVQGQLLLFLHHPTDANVLKLVTPQMDVPEGSLLQIVLSGKVAIEDLYARQHVLYIHSYKSPHFCEFCGEMLWGLVKQGLKCDACGLNFHKRCVYKVRDDCLAYKPFYKMSSDEQVKLNGSAQLSNNTRRGSNQRLQVPHSFVGHNFTLPTVCQYCHKLLPILGQSMQCKDCKINCHKKCQEYLPNNCQGEARGASNEDTDSCITDSIVGEENDCDTSFDQMSISSTSTHNPHNPNSTPPNNHPSFTNHSSSSSYISPIALSIYTTSTTATTATTPNTFQAPSTTTTTPTSATNNPNHTDNQQNTQDMNLRSSSSHNIPLQRVVQSFRNVKVGGANVIRSDWVVWWTNLNYSKRHHFWSLDSKSITFHSDETQKRYFKVIQLKDISRITLKTKDQDDKSQKQTPSKSSKCVFEIAVAETLYMAGEVADDGGSTVEFEKAVRFEAAIRQALMPLVPDFSKGKKSMEKSSNEEKIVDISQRYEIFPDEVLGSGQFGIVYGAKHIINKHDVAIKVVDKTKFKEKQEAQLKNEVSILQNIDHPGVVNLEFVHESPDKIYVVMEKLKGDMLEMILSSVNSKLTERTTKFLVYQILMSLKYLHDNNIVHCDLKPENVLLASSSPFPQVKLCDFGFAKIIGEKSFRRSIVGTPAYLAPEVLKNKRYNRSLDMWSVGVILYVSLSGTFPFNEDEDINDQIHNAAFMFPKVPWSSISKQAIDLITRILQVQLRNRFKVLDALSHSWMQDYQCWCDLKALEKHVGMNYLTTKDEDIRWTEYAKNKRLAHWTELGYVENAPPTRL